MAIEQNVQYEEAGLEALGRMQRPIPGESLMNDPENPQPFEGPPEFTDMREALDYILQGLLQEDTYISIVSSVNDGVPISDIVQQLLYVGFTEGKWNPDMVLILVEPLMYMIMALCEKAGVQYTIYRGEDQDFEEEDAEEMLSKSANDLNSLEEAVQKKASGNITDASIPAELAQKIETFEVPEEVSLMAKPKPSEESNSLLGRG